MSQIKDFYIIRLNVADTCKYHTDTLADIDKATPEALCIGAFVPAYRQAVADLMGVVNPEYATMFVNNSHACGARPILFSAYKHVSKVGETRPASPKTA